MSPKKTLPKTAQSTDYEVKNAEGNLKLPSATFFSQTTGEVCLAMSISQARPITSGPRDDVRVAQSGALGKSKTTTAIKAVGLSKTYGVVKALSSVDLTIKTGTIHSLVGANGAGKSTFLGCIAGRVAPSDGKIDVFGEPFHFGDPHHAHQVGIATVFQELTIIPAMSALENVFLGQNLSRGGIISWGEMRRIYEKLCHEFHVSIPWNAIARSLSVADQQMLEIMRCVHSDARIFLFDEPTAALATPERRSLFKVIRSLRDKGKALVIVSHNLDEVLEISDVITVFRDGKLSRHAPVKDWSEKTLVEAMLGRYASVERTVRPLPMSSPPNLDVRGLTVHGVVHDVSLEVRKGEIVGLAGLVGSGRSTILRSLAGLLGHQATAEITINGSSCNLFQSPRAALAHGIALIPEDRKSDGLILGMNGSDNIICTDFSKVSNYSILSKNRTQDVVGFVVKKFGFDPNRLGSPVRDLSGGNQQKILLSKWNYRTPAVLLIDEPTRGIDVGAKSEILETLQDLALEGMSILMVSSELEEIAAICNTIYTISKGRVTGRIDNDRTHVTSDDILEKLFEV